MPAALTVAVGAALSSPLAAQAAVTPSLKNLINSVIAGEYLHQTFCPMQPPQSWALPCLMLQMGISYLRREDQTLSISPRSLMQSCGVRVRS